MYVITLMDIVSMLIIVGEDISNKNVKIKIVTLEHVKKDIR